MVSAGPEDVTVPDGLRQDVGAAADGEAWLRRLPALVDRARTRWGLRLDAPFPSGRAAWTAPARTRDGEDAVVKIVFPHAEAAGEAAALRAWTGTGAAAELLDHDGEAWTLLLRRCRPGHGLEEDRALREQRVEGRLQLAGELLGQLHAAGLPASTATGVAVVPAQPGDAVEPDESSLAIMLGLANGAVMLGQPGGTAPGDATGAVMPGEPGAAVEPCGTAIAHLATTAAANAELLRERTHRHAATLEADPGLLGEAAGLLEDLPGTASRTVLLHGDYNPGNLLADDDGARRRWVTIDPKPALGDPAFDPWPLLSQVGEPFAEDNPGGVLRVRLRALCAAAGLEPDRVAAWSMARACESALWRMAVGGDRDGALEELAQARTWARLAG